MMKNKLKVALLGAGTIVPDFLLSSTYVDMVEPYGIFGVESDMDKMKALSEEYKFHKIYTDYDMLLEDEQIDIVYVALPNHLHYSFAKKALEKRKHVIMEKPFCSSMEQAKELFEIAEMNHCFLFEAMPNIHFPNFKEIQKNLDSLGDIKIAEVNVSKYSRRYDDFKNGTILPAFDYKKDGGALMDMGVYNIHFIVGLFGCPINVSYFPNMERNVDTSGILILEYENFQVSAIAAKDCSAPSCINIQGDKGYIHSTSTTHIMQGIEIKMNDGETQSIDLNVRTPHERLAYEIEEFARVIQEKDVNRFKQLMEQTLTVMNVIALAKKKCIIK